MKKWFQGHGVWYRISVKDGKVLRELPKFRVKPIFKWFDFWVGFFIDTDKRLVYFFPVPMFGFCVGYQFKQKQYKD